MHARCSVPVTPDQIQFAGGALLLSEADEGGAARASFESGYASDLDDRWSARRTLLFIMASNAALWWMIAYALRAVA